MDLPRSLVKEFANITTSRDESKKKSVYVRGTVKMVSDKKFVQLDGSDSITPLTETVDVQDGDRILVSIENHTATVIGNFSYPPSARKEQEAIDKADDAIDKSEDANNKADDAIDKSEDANNKAEDANNKVQGAIDKAEDALDKAGEASDAADEAKKNAQDSITAADEAKKNADEAKQAADEANKHSQAAKEEAEKAQDAIAGAKDEIGKITDEVTNVKGDISSALDELQKQAAEIEGTKQVLETEYSKKTEVSEIEASLKTEISTKVGELQTTVEEKYAAKTDLVDIEGKLQSQITQNAQGIESSATKIEKIEADTEEAQKEIDKALESAASAKTEADNAKTKAEQAQASADEAKQNANEASDKAQSAQEKAEEARAAADAADKAVQSAQSDLNEAKENLSNVTNRVGATEQEIKDAQEAVDKAQEEVNKALADAAEAEAAAKKAQGAADQAQTDADNAKISADEAQKKADNAQLVADEAREEAIKAQEEVDKLTYRVTEAETKITQNAEAIEMTAKKVEEVASRKIIKDTTMYWYLSTSNTEVTGGTWETKPPEYVQGRYYWQKTVIEYTDGTSKESEPICITVEGPEGPGGEGSDGKSVAIVYLYQRSSSLPSKPTATLIYNFTTGHISGDLGNWSSTIPNGTDPLYIITTSASSTEDTCSIPKTAWTNPVVLVQNGADGKDGEQGIPGKDGADGKTTYFHVMYSSVPNPTSSSQMTKTPSEYIGTYVDYTEADSTDPKKYTWSKFQGSDGHDGEQGIPGTNGEDGKTSYLHIAYANSADGKDGFSTTVSLNKIYIGQYTDFEQADSTDYRKYTWTKIKGEDGVDGSDGTPGLNVATVYLYQRAISKPSKPSSSLIYTFATGKLSGSLGYWSQTIPTGTNPLYVTLATAANTASTDSISATEWSDPNVLAQNGENGSDGRTIKSISAEYYVSTSKTTQTGGYWSSTMPTWSKGKYLWIRNKIVYENPSGTEYTNPYCDSSWEATNDVADDLHTNYYTKTETEAKIKVESESITSSVKKEIATIEKSVDLSQGKMLFTDPTFKEGYNNVELYDNVGGKVTLTRIAKKEDNPLKDSSYELEISNKGNSSPALGGFKILHPTRANAIFTYRIVAKIPKDYKLMWYYDRDTESFAGTNSKQSYVTSNEGTGNYTEYIIKLVCGATGTFSNIGFFALNGQAGTASNPVKWYVAYATVYDMTDTPDSLTNGEAAENAQKTADSATEKADSVDSRVTVSESTIKQLSDSISHLVTDENGSSLMEQTSNGWTFNMGQVNGTLNDTKNQLNNLSGKVNEVDKAIDGVNNLANDLAKKTAYINITTVNGQPAIELGQSSNSFKLRITNTSIDFMEGTSRIAYISNKILYIEKAIIKDELQIGETEGFVWKRRSNGNMGLRWVGGV